MTYDIDHWQLAILNFAMEAVDGAAIAEDCNIEGMTSSQVQHEFEALKTAIKDDLKRSTFIPTNIPSAPVNSLLYWLNGVQIGNALKNDRAWSDVRDMEAKLYMFHNEPVNVGADPDTGKHRYVGLYYDNDHNLLMGYSDVWIDGDRMYATPIQQVTK